MQLYARVCYNLNGTNTILDKDVMMKRQMMKIFILILMILTLSAGGKAIQINNNQKFQLNNLALKVHEQDTTIKSLESLEAQIDEYIRSIDEQTKVISDLNMKIESLQEANQALMAQKEALSDKVVYLTFDDGPSQIVTKKIIEILNKYGVKATFFVQGRNVVKYPEILKSLHEAGHTIGNHSYSHNYTVIYESEDSFWSDFNQCQDVVFEQIGVYPQVFRFPGGSNSSSNLNSDDFVNSVTFSLIEKGMQYFDWNIDSGDAASKHATADLIKTNAMVQLAKKKNAIVLFHDTDAKLETVKALPQIIEYYLAMGYRFDVLKPNGYTSHFK